VCSPHKHGCRYIIDRQELGSVSPFLLITIKTTQHHRIREREWIRGSKGKEKEKTKREREEERRGTDDERKIREYRSERRKERREKREKKINGRQKRRVKREDLWTLASLVTCLLSLS
jgi:hypothetical protein